MYWTLPTQFTLQCSALQKTTMVKCKAKINLYKSISEIPTPCYSGFWVQYHSGSLKHHKHWFCPNDFNYCISGIEWKFVVVRLIVIIVWPIQEGTNLTQKEIMTLEEVGFSFGPLCKNNPWSLFGSHSFSLSNSHVLAINCDSLVRLIDVSCWPTTRGGKKLRQPSVFKITQHHTINWEVSMLFLQCTISLAFDVSPLGYGRIYNVLSDKQWYNTTIGNFLGCSCVYFVTMLASSLGGRGAYV